MPSFILDGKQTEYEPGQTILEVCHALGSDVPHSTSVRRRMLSAS